MFLILYGFSSVDLSEMQEKADGWFNDLTDLQKSVCRVYELPGAGRLVSLLQLGCNCQARNTGERWVLLRIV